MSKVQDAMRGRMESVYMVIMKQEDPRGAQTWFADQTGVHRKTVSRWFRDPTSDTYLETPLWVHTLLKYMEYRARMLLRVRQRGPVNQEREENGHA